jgi:hypothetical protein
MNSGILMLAVGLVGGLMLGQALKQCPIATPTTPATQGHGFWDVLVSGIGAAKDIFD